MEQESLVLSYKPAAPVAHRQLLTYALCHHLQGMEHSVTPSAGAREHAGASGTATSTSTSTAGGAGAAAATAAPALSESFPEMDEVFQVLQVRVCVGGGTGGEQGG